MSRDDTCRGCRSANPTRRDLLSHLATGLGGIALTSMLANDGLLAADAAPSGWSVGDARRFAPRARRIIQVFLPGGLSHIDSFDYKPELTKHHGKAMPGDRPETLFQAVGLLHKPHFGFKQYGQAGKWMSSLFPNLADLTDELTFIHSMVAESANHIPAIYQATTGFRMMGFPSLGSWLSYGLGSLSQSLPTFVVMPDPRGLYAGGVNYWGSGFLPAEHQGVMLHPTRAPVRDLQSAKPVDAATQADRLSLLNEMNRQHLVQHPGDSSLVARIRTYEMAARMQTAVPEATDLASEPKGISEMYGVDQPESAEFARRLILARRLLERGVRFVQLWSGGEAGGPNWDAHDNVPGNQGAEAKRIDKPLAGLLKDLRQRGMLDDTLVMFSTEFGRTPFAQAANGQLGTGRDHNHTGFTVWLAGAGLKRGFSYGATDELGYKAVGNPVTVYDFHATILRLLGIDHEKLTYYHNGIRRRLTNVSGQVVEPLLA